jgi:hypothetical protein
MKLTELASMVVVASVALACNAKAGEVTFPLVNLTISGTVSYNSNSPASNGKLTKSALTKVSLTTKSLIGLLNASPAVTNTLMDVTKTNQIPAGSYFVFDLDNTFYYAAFDENPNPLIITNKNGFSFTLDGYDSVAATDYVYGYLNLGNSDFTTRTNIIGSYSKNDTTGAGSESDLASIEFYFNDSNGNRLHDYGNGTLKWSFGSVSGSVQKTTLSVSFPVPDGYSDTVKYTKAIAQNIKASGKGTGNMTTGIFPFYLWWVEE